MTLKLSKTNTPAYDYISDGGGSNPVTVTGVLDGSGGTADSCIAVTISQSKTGQKKQQKLIFKNW